jgi:peptidoglycan/LPS O-acetylase OafA/YrhL
MDGVRIVFFFWGICLGLAMFMGSSPMKNIWRFYDFYQMIALTWFISAQIGIDMFLFFTPIFITLKFRNLELYHNQSFTPLVVAKVYASRVLRIFPLYYFVFFLCWLVVPYTPGTAQGYIYDTLITNCEGYWWSNLLFLNNWFPAHQDQTQGCFFWNLNICNDLQLFLLTPFLYMIYRKSRWAALIIADLVIAFGVYINYQQTYEHNLMVGGISLNNYDLVTYTSSKPYMVIMMPAFGFQFVAFYIRTLEYKQAIKDGKDVQAQFSILHCIATNSCVRLLMNIVGLAAIFIIISLPKGTQENAYAWDRQVNATYFAVSKHIFTIGLMLLLMPMFVGRSKGMRKTCSKPLCRNMSRITYGAFLIYPMLMLTLVCSTYQSIMLTQNDAIFWLLGPAFLSLVLSIPLWYFIDAPVQGLRELIFKAAK